MRDRGVFLRAQGSNDHHCLFALKREQVKGVHHVSFAVTNFDELLIGGQHMEKLGWKTQVGPGRHVIGSNYFWYFHNPCGGAVEYYADMDYLTDAWTRRAGPGLEAKDHGSSTPRWLIAWTVLLLSQVADLTQAETFPHKAIRAIVPFAAGASSDLIAPMVIMELSANESAGSIAAASTPAQQTVADVAPITAEFGLQQD
jgi:hypothetical protein